MSNVKAKVFKHGNSQAISLNKEALYMAGLSIGDNLECHIEGKKLIFEKKNEPSFKEQIHEFYKNGGVYKEREIFSDKPKGNEIW